MWLKLAIIGKNGLTLKLFRLFSRFSSRAQCTESFITIKLKNEILQKKSKNSILATFYKVKLTF
jgi:hypothetical protein